MAVLGHLADVLRTSLICVTVAFLGWLAYSLIQPHFVNPPTYVDPSQSNELDELRSELDTLHDTLAKVEARSREMDRLQRDVGALQKAFDENRPGDRIETARLGSDLDKLSVRAECGLLPDGTAIEYGTVLFQRPEDYELNNCRRIKFQNTYKSPPLIFTNQWQTAGHWVAAHAQQVTATDALMCVSIAEQNRNYRCQIAYIVIGQLAE